MLRLEKMLHPSDGVASPEFYFLHREGFQEASDWPSKKSRAASTEAALRLQKASHAQE